jgi:hypothetical protein
LKVALAEGAVLGHLPAGLRGELLTAYDDLMRHFRAERWEPSELNGGKLCEVVYSILRGHVDGSFPASARKPKNMVDACRGLEAAGDTFPRSVRIQIPRMLIALYEVRNNRGVGHVGGDVDPNHMDAAVVVSMARWIMAELVRIFHDVDTRTATDLVDLLATREVTAIWTVAGRKRVLNTKLTMKEKSLILLYGETGPVAENDLLSWVEHSNPSVFRRDVLRPMHKSRLIEFDEVAKLVNISPLGARFVETNVSLIALP